RSIVDGSGWFLWSEHPDIGERKWIKRDAENPRKWHVRTESWLPSLVVEANERDRNKTAGRRFGDGLSHVGRIPMRDLYNELGEPFRTDDQGYLRAYLNRHPHLKTTDKRL